MKIELPANPPLHLKEQWEGQFSLFPYYTFVIDVPAPVFVVTTLKENGLANAALSAWGMPGGNGKEPKFFLQVHNYTDSRRLIELYGEFVVSYLPISLYLEMMKTVNHYDGDTDEILASGLRPEPSAAVKPPRVAECFACYECRVDWMRDIESGEKVTTLVQASVVHAAIEDSVCNDSLKDTLRRRQWAMYASESVNPATGAGDGGLFMPLDLEKAVNLA